MHRVPFDAAQAVATPMGLKMDDPAESGKVWAALTRAVDQHHGRVGDGVNQVGQDEAGVVAVSGHDVQL